MPRNNSSGLKISYLQQKAENWVSVFVLGGCVIITVILVVTAFRAIELAERLGAAPASDLSQSY